MRISLTKSPGTMTDGYTYDAADQMLTAGGVNYTYDNNGNQTGRGGDSFNYDHENRLTKITPPNTPVPDNPCYDVTGDGYVDIQDQSAVGSLFGAHTGDPNYDAFYDLNSDGFIDISDISMVGGQFGKACPRTFAYNADGLRVARGGSWLNSKYVWDVNAGLPVILRETDSHQTASGLGTDNTYVYGLGLISVTDRTGAQTYYTTDGLGSTTDLTDASAARTDGYSYDVFGASTHSPGSSTQPFQFTGQQTDADSGLQYLRARYYDPVLGRFIGRDPLAGQLSRPPTQNRFVYVRNNPASSVDPLGLCGPFDPGDCVSDATSAFSGIVSDVYNNPSHVAKNLDKAAFTLDATAAAVTDVSAAVGCTVGPEGCGGGYLVGYFFTRPATIASTFISAASSTITCLDAARVFGDKEGSSFTDCGVSVTTTVYGATPEPNISAAIAGYQVCYDMGDCQAPWRYNPWSWNWSRHHGW